MSPDPRTCTPDTAGICHPDATCTPVTPYVCSATRPRSYRCECNQGYTGDGLTCTGEIKLAAETVFTYRFVSLGPCTSTPIFSVDLGLISIFPGHRPTNALQVLVYSIDSVLPRRSFWFSLDVMVHFASTLLALVFCYLPYVVHAPAISVFPP